MRLWLLLLLVVTAALADSRGTCFSAQKQLEKLEALLTKPYYKAFDSETYKPFKELSAGMKAALKEHESDVRRAETTWTRVKGQLQGLPADEMVTAELAWGEAVMWLLKMNLEAVHYFHGMPSSYDPDRSSGMMDAKQNEIPTLKQRYLATRK